MTTEECIDMLRRLPKKDAYSYSVIPKVIAHIREMEEDAVATAEYILDECGVL